MHIFIHRDDEQVGPFSEADVRTHIAAGELVATDHVWWDGQDEWVPLSESSMFAPLFASGSEQSGHPEFIEEIEPMVEPEIKPGPAAKQEPKAAAQKRSPNRRRSSSRRKAKSNMGWIIGGIVVGVAILGGIGYYLLGTDSQDFSSLLNQPPQPYQVVQSQPDQSPATPPVPNTAPASNATTSPLPTPMATSPQLSPAPQPPRAPSFDPATNAAPPLAPNSPANQ